MDRSKKCNLSKDLVHNRSEWRNSGVCAGVGNGAGAVRVCDLLGDWPKGNNP